MQALAQSTGGLHFRILEERQISKTFMRIAAILTAPPPHPVAVVPEAARFGHWPVPQRIFGSSFGGAIVFGTLSTLLLLDRKSTRLNSSHIPLSRMPSSA